MAGSSVAAARSAYFKKAETNRKLVLFIFLAPFTVLFLLFTIVPVFYSIFLSLTNYNMIQQPGFIGLANYKMLLMDDEPFGIAVKNTLLFAVFIGPISYVLQFTLAWIVNKLPFRRLFTLAFYMPALNTGLMLTIWTYIFSNDRYGFVNDLLLKLGIINMPILWLDRPDTIVVLIILISVWYNMGVGFLVLLAGLQNVSQEMYEAGRIDGIGNNWQELVYITIPLMKPQMLFAAVMSVVGAFSVFDVSRFVAGFPSKNYIGHTVVGVLFDHAFVRAEMGYASAAAVVLFLATFIINRVLMRALADKTQ